MRNKERKHKATNGNCKGFLTFLTRGITKMGSSLEITDKNGAKKYMKKKWSKRVRGYFKSQTKEFIINERTENN